MTKGNFPIRTVGIAVVVALALIVLISIGGLTYSPPSSELETSVDVSDTTVDVSDTTVDAPETIKLNVTGEEFKFDQTTINVKKGSIVQLTFTNVGQIIHTFDIQEYGVATGFINSGETTTVEFKADREGEFAFFCNVSGHKELGMLGKIIVQP